jgi:hypothetical protein
MFKSPEERALRYHNYAAFLRRLAAQTRAIPARTRLRQMADQLDEVGASIHRPTLAA